MSRPRAFGVVGVAAAIASLALCGCVNLPASGLARTGIQPSSGGPGPQGVQLVAAPPGNDWYPTQIVTGFIAASGSALSGSSGPGDTFAVARQYLTPGPRGFGSSWSPNPASATVIDATPQITEPNVPTHITGAGVTAQVTVTSRVVEQLKPTGNLVVSSKGVYTFNLAKVAGQWRIDGIDLGGQLSRGLLLLTLPDFTRDYQARNLYFVPADSSARTLVPDPVFIRQQAGTQSGASQLVYDLLEATNNLTGWLSGAVVTAFPSGAKVAKPVQVSALRAVVTLGGPGMLNAIRDPTQLRRMEAELVSTLTLSPYSGNAQIDSVLLQVGSSHWLLLPQDFSGWVPQQAASTLYYQAPAKTGQWQLDISRSGSPGTEQVSWAPGITNRSFSAIAVSPYSPAVVAACRGSEVYVAKLQRLAAAPARRRLPASCTSLSWDNSGDLWATAGSNVLILPTQETGRQPRLGAPAYGLPFNMNGAVVTMRIAPDGVRVAMIVRTGSRTGQVIVAAISRVGQVSLAASDETVRVGSDIADPAAVAWLDSNHLLVLGGSDAGAQQLFEVPLNGGPSSVIPSALPGQVTSLAFDGQSLVAGTSSGGAAQLGQAAQPNQSPRIFTSTNVFNSTWPRSGSYPGITPVYPG